MKFEFVEPTEWNKDSIKRSHPQTKKRFSDKSNECRVDFNWNFKNSLIIPARPKKKVL